MINSEFIVGVFSGTREKKETHSVKRVFRTVKITLNLVKINSTLYKFKKGESNEEKQSKDESVKECVICCQNECDSIFMPCGHAGICYECALKLLETTRICHICRGEIKKILKMGSGENKEIMVTEFENP